jgi:hypothetical protein
MYCTYVNLDRHHLNCHLSVNAQLHARVGFLCSSLDSMICETKKKQALGRNRISNTSRGTKDRVACKWLRPR